VQEVFGPGSEQEWNWQGVGHLGCRAHARHREVELVDWVGAIARIVLNRAAYGARLGSEPDRFSGCGRIMRKTIFQININWEIRSVDNGLAIRDYLVSAYLTDRAAEHVG
jgi:hypothetical protein